MEDSAKVKRLDSMLQRKQLEVNLFERKFIDYRNKMLEVLDELNLKDESPEVQVSIRKFLEEEQKDVTFNPTK